MNPPLAFSDQEWSGIRPPNCKCHSKNQKMVEMHKPFGVNDCLICHQPSGMERGGERREKQKNGSGTEEKKEDKVCKGCHALKRDHPKLPQKTK